MSTVIPPRRWTCLLCLLQLFMVLPVRSDEVTLKWGDDTFSLVHARQKRTYQVHVPPSYDPQRPTPVVLVLHGGGGNGRGMKALTRMDEASDRHGFLAVYPDGSGTRVLGKTIGSWNAGRCCPRAMTNGVDDVGFIRQLIAKLQRDFAVDVRRIYATGHSNGSQMAFRLACELSGTIAAIAPAGAQGVFDACAPERPVPVLSFHGTADPCSPYHGGRAGGCADEYLSKAFGIKHQPYTWETVAVPQYLKMWKRINGVPDTSQAVYQRGKATCASSGLGTTGEVVLCTVEGMGHTWPGGTYGIPCQRGWNRPKCRAFRTIVGALTHDIDANDVMWDFFERHPMPES